MRAVTATPGDGAVRVAGPTSRTSPCHVFIAAILATSLHRTRDLDVAPIPVKPPLMPVAAPGTEGPVAPQHGARAALANAVHPRRRAVAVPCAHRGRRGWDVGEGELVRGHAASAQNDAFQQERHRRDVLSFGAPHAQNRRTSFSLGIARSRSRCRSQAHSHTPHVLPRPHFPVKPFGSIGWPHAQLYVPPRHTARIFPFLPAPTGAPHALHLTHAGRFPS